MQKIAIISDIHGNIPALDAVMNDIKSRDIHKIFCLGDMVGKGPYPEIAVDRVKNQCEVVVQGNWDDAITKESDYETMLWHQNRLGKQRIDYLASLPFSIDFWMSGKFIRLFHASAESVHKRVLPWDSIEERLAMFHHTHSTGFSKKEPDVVGYGDIHSAYIQNYKQKSLFNVGSVGNPLDHTQASYVILEGNYESDEISPFSIQFVRVPYDIELSIQQAIDEDMPELQEYIIELRTGKYRGIKKG
ncbi:metallophosphoesterase family protein [Chengkuizengella axinellae]|uniref:Metallophosphoesterase family protein n=1 Tax=Chengkuizengella axinellae TaxID=3064388 RepID=A0ABT9J241_9BACL|nr:metallophosphoesterase family protein [Chengkuizengella sp. 2205SS18-9]MDP5275492.1 metallophosphoesterase family protein [Chengkuizengella sp. 2205SS18-9]